MAKKRNQPCPCGSGKRYKKCCGFRGETPAVSELQTAQENVTGALSTADFLRAGATAAGQGQLDEAEACFRQAVTLKPDYAEAHYNLGLSLRDQGKLDDTVASFRRALTLKPDYAEAHNNLGLTLHDQGKLD